MTTINVYKCSNKNEYVTLRHGESIDTIDNDYNFKCFQMLSINDITIVKRTKNTIQYTINMLHGKTKNMVYDKVNNVQGLVTILEDGNKWYSHTGFSIEIDKLLTSYVM